MNIHITTIKYILEFHLTFLQTTLVPRHYYHTPHVELHHTLRSISTSCCLQRSSFYYRWSYQSPWRHLHHPRRCATNRSATSMAPWSTTRRLECPAMMTRTTSRRHHRCRRRLCRCFFVCPPARRALAAYMARTLALCYRLRNGDDSGGSGGDAILVACRWCWSAA